MHADARIYVAGSRTFVGRAIVERLAAEGFTRVVGFGDDEPNATDPAAVDRFFADVRPEYVFVTAGAQAGIAGNVKRPADLMIDNLRVVASVIPAAQRHGAVKLLYLGSSCIYPKQAAQPFHPDMLWTGPVEPTSDAYATAKLAGVKLVDAIRRQHGTSFIAAIAADAYGPGDDFSVENSHVGAGLIRRAHEARVAHAPVLEIWGTGTPRREFIYVDDLASACLFAMRHYDAPAPINLGVGQTTSIADLARLVCDVVGYTGQLRFDTSRPDGIPLKGLDSSTLRELGWQPTWDLRRGLEATYAWYARALAPVESPRA